MNSSRKEKIPGYLHALDGLRAVSLIFIVMFHTWQQSWIFANIQLTQTTKLFDLEIIQRFGYVAIDAFFVLSGFCLFYPIARDMFGESKFTGWKQFLIKRVRRIYPAYIILLVATIVFPKFSYAVYDTKNIAEVTKHFITHLLFIHTWDADTLGSTISTAWTMGIEVQFYVLFPLICIPFRKKPILTFLGMLLAGQGLRLWLIGNVNVGPMVIQAITPAYLDVFGWGMICAYFVVYARNKIKCIDKLKLLMTLMSAICVVLAVYYMFWLREAKMPSGYDASVYFRFLYRGIFAALIAGFIFTACFSYDFWERKIWGNKFFVFLSSISYTMYLCHQNIYILLKKVNIPYSSQKPVMNDRPAMEGMVFICITASLIISVLITKYIEEPIVKYGFKGATMKLVGNVRSIPSKVFKSNTK